MTPEQLVEIPGIGEKMVEKIHQSVAAHFEALEAQAPLRSEVILPEEGVLEAEAGAVEEIGAVEMTPEEAVAEGDQEAAEESAEAADRRKKPAGEEAATEAGELESKRPQPAKRLRPKLSPATEAETEERGEAAES